MFATQNVLGMLIENFTISGTEVKMRVKLPTTKVSKQIYSDEYNMQENGKFQLRSISIDNPPMFGTSQTATNSIFMILVKFKSSSSKHLTVKITSEDLYFQDICFSTDSQWHLLTDNYVAKTDFDLSLKIDDSVNGNDINRLKLLYDDDNLIDFELRGDDGSVKVHKAILATSSPVFKTLLQGEWKESTSFVNMEGMSKVTLQEFKEYIYLNSLSLTVSPQLLIIAMRYKMPDMEAMSVQTLVKKMKPENAYDLLEFAITQKSTKLILAILKCIEKGLIPVDLIEKHMFENQYGLLKG